MRRTPTITWARRFSMRTDASTAVATSRTQPTPKESAPRPVPSLPWSRRVAPGSSRSRRWAGARTWKRARRAAAAGNVSANLRTGTRASSCSTTKARREATRWSSSCRLRSACDSHSRREGDRQARGLLARLPGENTLQDDPRQRLLDLAEVPRRHARHVHDRLDLWSEVRVMLRRRPDQEDQVIRVDRRQLSLIDPMLDHRCLALYHRPQSRLQVALQERRALHDFVGEHARCGRIFLREIDLLRDVLAEFQRRVAVAVQFPQGNQPDLERAPQNREVEVFLSFEVVVQVCLGNPSALGD